MIFAVIWPSMATRRARHARFPALLSRVECTMLTAVEAIMFMERAGGVTSEARLSSNPFLCEYDCERRHFTQTFGKRCCVRKLGAKDFGTGSIKK